MSDMLVKLYELADDWSFFDDQAEQGVTVRKPIGPEKRLLVDWVAEQFGDAWAAETDCAMVNIPRSCYVAIMDERVIGFADYDATALGFFGPIGVHESCRGKGTGKALLLACLLDMKLKGYGYAIIGSTDLLDFYTHCCGAAEIPDSSPSVWKTWVRRGNPARQEGMG